MINFEGVAEQEGWTLATQVGILLEYIENQQSEEAFNDFISEKVTSVDEENLGLSEALEDQEFDDSQHLYKCSVGVYATVDAETPITEYEVFVSEQEEDIAIEKAVALCESKHGHKHKGFTFASESKPEICIDTESFPLIKNPY